jgi:hypothetical protein
MRPGRPTGGWSPFRKFASFRARLDTNAPASGGGQTQCLLLGGLEREHEFNQEADFALPRDPLSSSQSSQAEIFILSPFGLGASASPALSDGLHTAVALSRVGKFRNNQPGGFSLPFAGRIGLRNAPCLDSEYSNRLVDFANLDRKPLPQQSWGGTALIVLHPTERSSCDERLCQ